MPHHVAQVLHHGVGGGELARALAEEVLHAHIFALKGDDIVVFAHGGFHRVFFHQHRFHTRAHSAVRKALSAGKEAAHAAQLCKLFHIRARQTADALGGHFARVGYAAKGDVHGNGNLRARINAVDIAGGIGLGIAQPLRLAQYLVKSRARGLHGIENQVGGAVDNAAYPEDIVHAPGAQKIVQIGNASADAGRNAHCRAAVLGGLGDFGVVMGEHQLVGRDYVFARAQRAHDEFMGGLESAHQLHHRVDGSIFQYIFKPSGQLVAQPGNAPQIQHARNFHVRPLGHDFINP